MGALVPRSEPITWWWWEPDAEIAGRAVERGTEDWEGDFCGGGGGCGGEEGEEGGEEEEEGGWVHGVCVEVRLRLRLR